MLLLFSGTDMIYMTCKSFFSLIESGFFGNRVVIFKKKALKRLRKVGGQDLDIAEQIHQCD